ncbi:hypothetical protein CHCC14809_0695 [Bacillus licheniformis]|nr:hypothetical protein CHCC15291_1900 [Bacillus licheniformis]TWM81832.1 hypothetical protein CHCC14809_0695 [Bacillus licheniformis]TWN11788.1 hypothetical protein CHCC14561_1400 [Bacillus licheniformis]
MHKFKNKSIKNMTSPQRQTHFILYISSIIKTLKAFLFLSSDARRDLVSEACRRSLLSFFK